MNKIIIGLFLFGSVTAFGSDQAYEKLKEAYNQSDAPASFDYFDSIYKSTKRCVQIQQYASSNFEEVAVLKGFHIVGAIPDNGPMFPGSPGKKIETIYFTFNHLDHLQIAHYIPLFSTEMTDSDLKIRLRNDTNIILLEVLYLRTGNDGLVYFRRDGRHFSGQGPISEIAYGYCYPIKI